jgi:hypothetical protein
MPPHEKLARAKRPEPAQEDDGERLSCEECGESFNVNESGDQDRCPRCA